MNHRCVRAYCDGVFDLGPHAGHIGFFREVREQAARETGAARVELVVGVISDADVESYKRRPVVAEEHRAATVAACRYVDEVVANSPLVLTETFLSDYRIDLAYHGNDSKQETFFAVPIAAGIMRYCSYDPDHTGVSTTDLIRRIQARPIGV
jgi:choline-phosphate cytidylyltransferase